MFGWLTFPCLSFVLNNLKHTIERDIKATGFIFLFGSQNSDAFICLHLNQILSFKSRKSILATITIFVGQ